MNEITKDGKVLVETYLKDCKYVERLKRDLNEAEINKENSKDNLSKFLLPKDYKINENYCIWCSVEDEHGTSHANMVQVRVIKEEDDEIYLLSLHKRN